MSNSGEFQASNYIRESKFFFPSLGGRGPPSFRSSSPFLWRARSLPSRLEGFCKKPYAVAEDRNLQVLLFLPFPWRARGLPSLRRPETPSSFRSSSSFLESEGPPEPIGRVFKKSPIQLRRPSTLQIFSHKKKGNFGERKREKSGPGYLRHPDDTVTVATFRSWRSSPASVA